MKRTAIIVEKKLSPGEAANVSAILMGQTSISQKEIFDNSQLIDLSGNQHAAIKYSSVILKAGSGQLLNLPSLIKKNYPTIRCFIFSRTGQRLNNEFEQYRVLITQSETEKLEPVGIALVGDDSLVRKATKKFSILQ